MPYSTDLIQHFDEVTDPRRDEPVYPLTNILFMTICAVIAGSDDFVAIAKYAQTKKVWFLKILDLSTGIASHGRFHAILASIKPAKFGKALLQWITLLGSFKFGVSEGTGRKSFTPSGYSLSLTFSHLDISSDKSGKKVD